MLERTQILKFATTFFDERSTQVDAKKTQAFLSVPASLNSKHIGRVFLSWRTLSCRGRFFSRNSFLEKWTVGNPFLFDGLTLLLRIVCHSTCVSSRARTEHRLSIGRQSPIFLFLFSCSSARRGLLKLSCTGRAKHLTIFLFQVSDHHLFQSGVACGLTFFEQHHERTATGTPLSASSVNLAVPSIKVVTSVEEDP